MTEIKRLFCEKKSCNCLYKNACVACVHGNGKTKCNIGRDRRNNCDNYFVCKLNDKQCEQLKND